MNDRKSYHFNMRTVLLIMIYIKYLGKERSIEKTKSDSNLNINSVWISVNNRPLALFKRTSGFQKPEEPGHDSVLPALFLETERQVFESLLPEPFRQEYFQSAEAQRFYPTLQTVRSSGKHIGHCFRDLLSDIDSF